MADLVFAFDPALDRPLPVPDTAPPAAAERVAGAVSAATVNGSASYDAVAGS